jgi:hypothetical protein
MKWKAILAITKRFHSIWKEDPCFNCILVGVQEELIGSNNADSIVRAADKMPFIDPSMRSLFLYTWLDSFVAKVQKIYHNLGEAAYRGSPQLLLNHLHSIFQQLSSSIPSQAEKSESLVAFKSAMATAKEIILSGEQGDADASHLWQKLRLALETFLLSLAKIDPKGAIRELLSTANIIFCTLHTSGISAIKYSRKIDDLVIDEAAAATEVECCIPFFLHPKRLLAVGDPMQ